MTSPPNLPKGASLSAAEWIIGKLDDAGLVRVHARAQVADWPAEALPAIEAEMRRRRLPFSTEAPDA